MHEREPSMPGLKVSLEELRAVADRWQTAADSMRQISLAVGDAGYIESWKFSQIGESVGLADQYKSLQGKYEMVFGEAEKTFALVGTLLTTAADSYLIAELESVSQIDGAR